MLPDPAEPAGGEVRMTPLNVIYEDNHLLVVNKPAGVATMGAESGPTMHSLAADYLKRKFNKPGKAFVGIVSRLDTMTSGVLVLARTSKAASRLSQQFAGGESSVSKIYLAAVTPPVTKQHDAWSDFLVKDDRARRMRIVGPEVESAKQAGLRYTTVLGSDGYSLLAVQLVTGRKHQVRVQFADRGHPVIGDRKYGSARRFAAGVALHSWQLKIMHPTRRQAIWFSAPPPSSWRQLSNLPNDWDSVWSRVQSSLEAIDFNRT